MTNKLNVIISPVKRWFSEDKPIMDKQREEVKVYTCKDSFGSDVLIFCGWETWGTTNSVEISS